MTSPLIRPDFRYNSFPQNVNSNPLSTLFLKCASIVLKIGVDDTDVTTHSDVEDSHYIGAGANLLADGQASINLLPLILPTAPSLAFCIEIFQAGIQLEHPSLLTVFSCLSIILFDSQKVTYVNKKWRIHSGFVEFLKIYSLLVQPKLLLHFFDHVIILFVCVHIRLTVNGIANNAYICCYRLI